MKIWKLSKSIQKNIQVLTCRGNTANVLVHFFWAFFCTCTHAPVSLSLPLMCVCFTELGSYSKCGLVPCFNLSIFDHELSSCP